MIITLKSVRFLEEVHIPGQTEKRGIGSPHATTAPEYHEVTLDTDTGLVTLKHRTNPAVARVFVAFANVRDAVEWVEPPPVTEPAPVERVEPSEHKTLIVEKHPKTGKGVGRVIVGDPDDD